MNPMMSAATRARARELLDNVVADQRKASNNIERSFIDKSKMILKYKIDHFVQGTNFWDWARRFLLIMKEARVHETTQLLLLVQADPNSLTHEFWEFRRGGIALDIMMEHFAKLYKFDTDIYLELQLRNIRQDISEALIAFHTRWILLMMLDGNS